MILAFIGLKSFLKLKRGMNGDHQEPVCINIFKERNLLLFLKFH